MTRLIFALAILLVLTTTARAEDLEYCDKAKAARNAGNNDLAIEYLTLCIDDGNLSEETRATVFYNRGLVFAIQGQYDRAIADYDQAIRLNPDYAFAFNNRGTAYYSKGEYDKAIADYDQAIRLDSTNALAFYNRGLVFAIQGQYDRAIADFDQAIRLNPDYAIAFNNRGEAYRLKGEYDRAISDYAEAIRLDPESVEAYYNRGIVYYSKGEYDRAIANYDQAIRLNPDFAIAFNNRGEAYRLKGEYDRATSDFNEAIKLATLEGSEKAFPLSNRGIVFAIQGKYDQAIADFNEAIRLAPDSAGAYNNLAWLLATVHDARFRDGHRAVELAKKAMVRLSDKVLDEDKVEVYDTLAAAYAEAGRFADAVAEQQRAIEMLQAVGAPDDAIFDFRSRLDLYRRRRPYRQ